MRIRSIYPASAHHMSMYSAGKLVNTSYRNLLFVHQKLMQLCYVHFFRVSVGTISVASLVTTRCRRRLCYRLSIAQFKNRISAISKS